MYVTTFFFVGYFDVSGPIVVTISIILIYAIWYLREEVLSTKAQLNLNKILFITGGACLGVVIAFFGSAFIILATSFLSVSFW